MSQDTCARCPETSQLRWRRDLNPRTVLAVSRFQGECIRPLCHATADKTTGSDAADLGRRRGCLEARADPAAVLTHRGDLRPRQLAQKVFTDAVAISDHRL